MYITASRILLMAFAIAALAMLSRVAYQRGFQDGYDFRVEEVDSVRRTGRMPYWNGREYIPMPDEIDIVPELAPSGG